MDDHSAQPQWSEGSSKTFIDYGRYFVPERESQFQAICSLIPAPEESFHILELCCGEGLLAEALLERFPTSIVHCYDGSAEMLRRAQARLAGYSDRTVFKSFDLAASDWRNVLGQLHAVVSSLAIHHLDDEQKRELYKALYAALEPEGVLVIADVIRPATPPATSLAAEVWDDAVRQRSLAIDGNTQAYDVFRQAEWNLYRHPDPIDKPSRLLDQLNWLEAAGFGDVDVYWMRAGHAIFGGRKSSNDSTAVRG